jgi:hypothetical protein
MHRGAIASLPRHMKATTCSILSGIGIHVAPERIQFDGNARRKVDLDRLSPA